MAAMAGLLNHPMTAGQALTGTGANPMAAAPAATSSSASAASSGSSSATISANDFLTLLVTEMQNQDPTAQTDPNEYINQLVQVNSLEQLIDINQNLTTALGDPGTTASGSTSGQGVSAHATPGQTTASASSLTGATAAGKAMPATTAAHKTAGLPASVSPGSNTAAAISQFAKSAGAKHAPGNLSVPPAHGAAHKVAHALDGQSHTPKTPGKPAGAQ